MENNKIGMLSFHESLSFGATLQCFALQKVIRDMGYEPEFIDFQRKKCAEFNSLKTQPSTKERGKQHIIKLILGVQNTIQSKNNKKVDAAFEDFKKDNIKVGHKSFGSIEEIYKEEFLYNAFVTGSDQVWNPFNSILEVYGLGFVPDNVNTVAYAASMGVSKIPDGRKKDMVNALHGIRHISCREYEGAEELSKLLSRDVINVLDPTLLLSRDEWTKYESTRKVPDKYVLCFFLGSLDYPRKYAVELAKKNGCKLVTIPGSPKDMFAKGEIAKGCGPREFLELFHNAAFICTDSFHGTAFAINYNKPFYSFCRRGYNEATSFLSRIKDLLEVVGLSDRLIYPDSEVSYDIPELDYVSANKALEIEREKSKAYLRDALKS